MNRTVMCLRRLLARRPEPLAPPEGVCTHCAELAALDQLDAAARTDDEPQP